VQKERWRELPQHQPELYDGHHFARNVRREMRAVTQESLPQVRVVCHVYRNPTDFWGVARGGMRLLLNARAPPVLSAIREAQRRRADDEKSRGSDCVFSKPTLVRMSGKTDLREPRSAGIPRQGYSNKEIALVLSAASGDSWHLTPYTEFHVQSRSPGGHQVRQPEIGRFKNYALSARRGHIGGYFLATTPRLNYFFILALCRGC